MARRPVVALAALLVVIAPAATLAAAPPNDEVASPQVIIELPFEGRLETSEATPDDSDPECSTGAGNPTVWYSITPTETAPHGLSTFGSSYDTTLVLAEQGPDGLLVLACSDDAGAPTSAIVWPLEAGREYLVMVGACCDQPGGSLVLQAVRDPEVGSPAFAVPPDLSGFLEQRPRGAAGALWRDATAETIGATDGWTNKVEVADIDGDGLLDILHANGGDYDQPGSPELPRAWLNGGPGEPFVDASADIFGDTGQLLRVIKARDVTGDGIVDLVLGGGHQTQTRLLRGTGDGAFEDLTELLLPQGPLSVGDLEVGDVDADGDTDIVLADWGPGSPFQNAGGPVHLWRNTGEGWAEDAQAMPAARIGFSWDLELVDVDADWDLDVAVSCKVCDTSRLYLNDGQGTFSDVTETNLPAASNNYEFEAMDLDGDRDPDLVTVNDGEMLAERVLRNDGSGVFEDASAEWWPAEQNPGFDDNAIVFLDVESDGDADLVVGSLDGPDRLMINDGSGHLVADPAVFEGPGTPGTLGLALGDLDGDGRLDVVEGQGEVTSEDHVFLGTPALPPDTAPPVIEAVDVRAVEPGVVEVRARIHDRKTPVTPDDLSATVQVGDSAERGVYPLTHYGDALWRAVFEHDGDGLPGATVCASDRAGNEACLDA
jgi:hypothetical protein